MLVRLSIARYAYLQNSHPKRMNWFRIRKEGGQLSSNQFALIWPQAKKCKTEHSGPLSASN